jgi:hypothetical protein
MLFLGSPNRSKGYARMGESALLCVLQSLSLSGSAPYIPIARGFTAHATEMDIELKKGYCKRE